MINNKQKKMLTAVVLAKNEENNIRGCIKSLSFCDEVIVIDDYSGDKTEIFSSKLGAKVVRKKLDNDFAKQRNFGIEKAKYQWVFFVDADERISKGLANEIRESLKKGGVSAFIFKRCDFMWGRWLTHGEVGRFRAIRLIKKGSGKWIRAVHEKYFTEGKVVELKNPIKHYPHQNLNKFIKSVDKWSTIHAKANCNEGKRSNIFKIFLWPIGHFVKNYFLKLGFLDGLSGLVFAVVMSFHSYLSWSKLWLNQRKSL